MGNKHNFDQEIAIEQVAVDKIYYQFDLITKRILNKLAEVRQDGFGSTFAARVERDSFATFYENSLTLLRSAEDKLVFGKLDYDKSCNNQQYYIGRSGIFDQNHNPILIDWRSQIGGDFYAATSKKSRAVHRRRHIMITNREVVGLEDEVISSNNVSNDGLTIIGEGALLQAMQSKRSKHMQDIVSTIQQEQDAIIRQPLEGIHIIQGGPGTGKTAVALHRIAYLIYSYQQNLGSNGVLFVGPTNRFIQYVERVLPSLGESGVHQTTITGLLRKEVATIERTAEVDEVSLKGCKRMVKVIHKAINSFVTKLNQPLNFHINGEVLTLTPDDVKHAQSIAYHSHLPHNQARTVFVNQVLEMILNTWINRHTSDDSSVVSGRTGSRFDSNLINEIKQDIRLDKKVTTALNLLWMPLEATQLIDHLFSNYERLKYCTKSLYSESEVQYLHNLTLNNRSNLTGEYLYSSADVALIDEATVLLGHLKSSIKRQRLKSNEPAEVGGQIEYMNEVLQEVARDAQGIVTAQMLADRFVQPDDNDDKPIKYRHIVVDEAQELSYMEYRMLQRRSSTKSYTIVGDINQKASPAGVANWEELQEILGDITVNYLTINYRNSQEIAQYAYCEAIRLGLNVPETKSPRSEPNSVEIIQVSDTHELVAIATEYALELSHTGQTAIITQHPELIKPSIHYDIITAIESKGLEYDNVVIADSEQISNNVNGNANLYVAITRATSKLIILQSK